MKGFKLLSRVKYTSGEQLKSWASGSLRYIPGEWTEPNPGCGPLAVFRTLAHLERFNEFALHIESLAVYECEYEPSAHTSVWNLYSGRHQSLPVGTILADRVMLLKEVTSEGL